MTPESEVPSQIDRAFGAESRLQLLTEYFAGAGNITAANAWIHVYKLLLWTTESGVRGVGRRPFLSAETTPMPR